MLPLGKRIACLGGTSGTNSKPMTVGMRMGKCGQFSKSSLYANFIRNTSSSSSQGDVPQDHPGFEDEINFEDDSNTTVTEHFMFSRKSSKYWVNPVPQPVYTKEDLEQVDFTHRPPERFSDHLALTLVKIFRGSFDIVSRYKGAGKGMTKQEWLNRCIFLETVAGVPGMIAGMSRHLKSLRYMRRDYGWIHTLLAEAENERMHLLIFMRMKQPNFIFRGLVIAGQAVFFNAFFLAYIFSPKTCHRFVGYLEEEAVKTYTGFLQDVSVGGGLEEWGKEHAPVIAAQYYNLSDDNSAVEPTIRSVIACVRADESNHRDVNHVFASLDSKHAKNPFVGKSSHKT